MIYVANIARADNRRDLFLEYHGNEGFVFVDGIDGMKYSLGDEESGKPMWIESNRDIFVGDGLVHDNSKISPSEYGCAMSHLSMWKRAIADDCKYAIFMEDDGRLLDSICNIEEKVGNIFEDDEIGFISLIGDSYREIHTRLFDDRDIRSIRSLACYAMSRKMLDEIVCNYVAFVLPVDFHISFLYFESMRNRDAVSRQVDFLYGDKAPKKTFRAVGFRGDGLARVDMSLLSCMTRSGKKPWVESLY